MTMDEPNGQRTPNVQDVKESDPQRCAPRHRLQFTLRTLLAATVVMALCCGGPIQFIRWKWPDRRGPVTSQDQWPAELKTLTGNTDRAHINIEPLQVYCVASRFGNYEKHYWTMRSSLALLAFVTKDWRLSTIAISHHLVREFWAQMPLDWYPNDSLRNAQYFVSASLVPTGDSGYVVLYDKDRDTIIVMCQWTY